MIGFEPTAWALQMLCYYQLSYISNVVGGICTTHPLKEFWELCLSYDDSLHEFFCQTTTMMTALPSHVSKEICYSIFKQPNHPLRRLIGCLRGTVYVVVYPLAKRLSGVNASLEAFCHLCSPLGCTVILNKMIIMYHLHAVCITTNWQLVMLTVSR